jgi:hypothetical protein
MHFVFFLIVYFHLPQLGYPICYFKTTHQIVGGIENFDQTFKHSKF